jgi:hypothetical protein
MKSASERTNYRRIYKKTYWGGFRHNTRITDEIIDNRNRFITDYSIAKCVERWDAPKYIENITNYDSNRYLDHVEIYKMTDSSYYLLVSSPYASHGFPNYDDHIKNGWSEIYPLYSISTVTFIKLMDYKRYKIEKM